MIISLWGNNGSGVSTVAIKLALSFTKKEKNVLLVDTNFIAPQAKIWYPKEEINDDQSLSVILSNNVETEVVARKIKMANDYLGYLGYTQDLSINSIINRDDTPVDLLRVLNDLADVVIIDCQSNITQDILSFIALDMADTKIINLSPDLRGLSWYESNVTMLKEKWNNQDAQIIKTFSKVKINSPADAMEKQIGNVDFYLPYYEEIEEELYTGALGNSKYKGRAKKYGVIIESMRDTILDYYEKKPVSETIEVIDEDNSTIDENIEQTYSEDDEADAIYSPNNTSYGENTIIEESNEQFGSEKGDDVYE